MKKSLVLVSCSAACFAAGLASAQIVRDWHDLAKAEAKIQQVQWEVERAARANGFDMNGHAGKAVDALKVAQFEVHAAVQAAQVNTTPP
jgi:hypothetical protein